MSIRNKIRGIREIWQFENRWNLAFNRIFFPREPINVYRSGNIEFITDHRAGDANGARDVLTSDMYSKYLPEMNLDGPVNVLDIGANNGGFMLMLLREGVEIKKGASVELNPETFTRLHFNLGRNFRGNNIAAINAAVCGTPRKIAFSPNSAGSVADNIYAKADSSEFFVEGITFDDLYESVFGDERVDICKIDIEGAEFEIFANGNCEHIKKCRYLLMEIHHSPEHGRESVIRALGTLGFDERGGENKSDGSHYVHFFVNRTN